MESSTVLSMGGVDRVSQAGQRQTRPLRMLIEITGGKSFMLKLTLGAVRESKAGTPDSENRMPHSPVSLWRRGFVAMTIVMPLQWQRC